MILPEAQWINDRTTLEQHIKSWKKKEVLFLDTEFIRERTFFPILALLQIFDGDSVYLIEPHLLESNQTFNDLLTDANICKVLHSASEDCEVFYRHCDVILAGLWDTQLAASFLGEGFSISYAVLVDTYVNKTLDKSATRTDWTQRPLSREQIDYAIADVFYLKNIYEKQKEAFKSLSNKLNWFLQDCDVTVNKVQELDNIEEAYLAIRTSWKLSKTALFILKHLALWREQQAREQNLPRSFVLKDSDLMSLAIHSERGTPHSITSEWTPVIRRKYETTLLTLIKDKLSTDPEKMVIQEPVHPVFWKSIKNEIVLAQEWIKQQAQVHSISEEVLCSKKLLKNITAFWLNKKTQHSPAWTLWREELLGPSIRNIVISKKTTNL